LTFHKFLSLGSQLSFFSSFVATESQQSPLEDSTDAALASITKDGTRDDDHQAELRAMYLAGFQAASQAKSCIPNNYGGPPNSIDGTQNQQGTRFKISNAFQSLLVAYS
jgi:hypothetical protein